MKKELKSDDKDDGIQEPLPQEQPSSPPIPDKSLAGDAESPRNMDDDSADPFAASLFGSSRGPGSGLGNTLRALSGMMSGMSSRLRDILNNLRQTENTTMQLIALEELSNLLLVSNEDNLTGQFSPDPYVKELVRLMQPDPTTGEENPEMMILACRCLANLMEALRGSVANVVYGGAVPILCAKLLEVQYIDLAEQAISTLAKVSLDFPTSIVREGGLSACLQFLDFFATGTQRTAVTTAANCCRNIPHDCFAVVKDVMPILLNVIGNSDQKVVEQGCLCITRVIDSFKHKPDKLEELVDVPLLQAVLRLLMPGTTNLIGAYIHTEFLRVLAIVARASPRLSAELLKLNIVDTLYQILTGVSPPSETSDAASKIDSVVIMQALMHRPKDQVLEALNVICELLPRPAQDRYSDYDYDDSYHYPLPDDLSTAAKSTMIEQRQQLLDGCKEETRRFAIILLPTLTDVYSSTVNLNVRRKVLSAHLKILYHLDAKVIEEALRPVPYASFLASILSQHDHVSLVMRALQAAELLCEKLAHIYQYQFYREGVIGEIQKIASRRTSLGDLHDSSRPAAIPSAGQGLTSSSHAANLTAAQQMDVEDNEKIADGDLHQSASLQANASETRTDGDDLEVGEDDEDNESEDDHDDEDDDDDENDDGDEDDPMILRDEAHEGEDGQMDEDSSDSDDGNHAPVINGIDALATLKAQRLLEQFETAGTKDKKDKALATRQALQKLAREIRQSYSVDGNQDGQELFVQLAKHFDGDALEIITSSELLDSEIIEALLHTLAIPVDGVPNVDARNDFARVFMGSTFAANHQTRGNGLDSTAFTVLTHKLQDLLSRAEHFEVLTVNSNAYENSRSGSTSLLSKQIRLRLTADGVSDIPSHFREMVVSIHAIATFKALDDYLRPKITLSERPPGHSRRRDMIQQLASARMAQLAGASDSGLLSPFGADLSLLQSAVSTEARAAARNSSRPKTPTPTDQTVPPIPKPEKRRSSRRALNRQAQTDEAPVPDRVDSSDVTAQLECADEKQIVDEDADLLAHEDDLADVVGHLEEEMSDQEMPEPDPVNMEVTSSGKVTARQEDGTRVVTPLPPGTPVSGVPASNPSSQSPGVPPALGGSIASAGRPYSYAQILASVAPDWHLEFSIDGKQIPNETTIYRAVYHGRDQQDDSAIRGIWQSVHPIVFKKVKGPPPQISLGQSSTKDEGIDSVLELPTSLTANPSAASILELLGVLHELNQNLNELPEALPVGLPLRLEPPASFINTKLTAKMNRQLEEPLIVASNCLPGWSEDLARLFPFLFPFETRHLFLQSTSFGYSRSMARWQSSQSENDERRDRRRDDRPIMGRLQRQKVRISRTRILESAIKVMEMYGSSPSVLEVEYFEEVGTGLGPTLEFYATVSKEFSKKKLKLWRENESDNQDEFAFGKHGLFPAPMSDAEADTEAGKKILYFFKILGKFIARSMLDSRIIDVSFNPAFFRSTKTQRLIPSITQVRGVDQDLANSLSLLAKFAEMKTGIDADLRLTSAAKTRLSQAIEIHEARLDDLELDFTLPGYPSIELIANGAETAVTIENVQQYIDAVVDLTLSSGVQRQIDAFKAGFSQVFPFVSLSAFNPSELVMLFGRVEEDWSIETLMDSVKADHGFNMDSRSVKNLLQTMSELDPATRRDFLQFVTGSPKLPIGGFKSLTPMFTVVCKPSEPPYTSDDYLPSVMTCVNYLKLPDYTSQEVMKKRLGLAVKEGQGAFHLS